MAFRNDNWGSYPPSYVTRDDDSFHAHRPGPSPLAPYSNGSSRGSSAYPYKENDSYDSSFYRPHETHRDPMGDDSAVPLRPYYMKNESQTSTAPILTSDRFIRDATPGREDGYEQTLPDRPPPAQGWFKGKITWCVYFFTTVQIAVFIFELARNMILTGSLIEIKPTFNPMIGPSPYVLINVGARYQPCMHLMTNVNNTISWPCPNTTSLTNSATCSLAQLCGFNGMNIPSAYGEAGDAQPDQWWRFIVPIFLHAGFIHIGFNMLLQVTLGRDMELAIGSLRFLLVYLSAGIFGFVLGGNFAANGIASTGASGSLFGILALNLLDLLYHWRQRPRPIRDLIFILIDVAIAFVLGLLPGLDNFSHIGGFLMGLVLGVCLLRSPPALSRTLGEDNPSYGLMMTPGTGPAANVGERGGFVGFVRSPIGFFKGRKPLWWGWWFVRAGGLIGIIVCFVLLLRNFYVWQTQCGWCKYLSCINVSNWCDIGNLSITSISSKRSLEDLFTSRAR